MTTEFTFGRGDESPAIRLPWKEEQASTPGKYADLDLTGHSFTFTLTKGGTTSTPNATLTGGVGYVDIAWATSDLDLDKGHWRAKIVATREGRDRTYSPAKPLVIKLI